VRWSRTLIVRRLALGAVLAAGLLVLRGVEAQDTALKTPASELPKIDDVAGQLQIYIERLDESLAKADDYNEAKQSRVEKDAVTVAGLAGLLARHSGDHELKASAPGVQAAANEIAAKYREQAPAAAALLRIKQLQSGETKAEGTLDSAKTDAATDAAMLMKQIRFIDNRMKRAARDRSSSEKSRSEVAGHAATIAALAEPLARAAKRHAKTPGDVKEWIDQSNAMAIAAAKLNAAANEDAASDLRDALRAVDATCARCHADFR
jgi:hypothetical protein